MLYWAQIAFMIQKVEQNISAKTQLFFIILVIFSSVWIEIVLNFSDNSWKMCW
jgi:hypothetical protein